MSDFTASLAEEVKTIWLNSTNTQLKGHAKSVIDLDVFAKELNTPSTFATFLAAGSKKRENLLIEAKAAEQVTIAAAAAAAAAALTSASTPPPVVGSVTVPGAKAALVTYVPQIKTVTSRAAIAAKAKVSINAEGELVVLVDTATVEVQVAKMMGNVDKAQIQAWVASNNTKQDLWGTFESCMHIAGFPNFIGFCAATLLVSQTNRASMFATLKNVDIAKNRNGNVNKSLIYLAGNAGMASAMSDDGFKTMVINSPNPLVADHEPAAYRSRAMPVGASQDDYAKAEALRKAAHQSYVETFKEIKQRYLKLFTNLDAAMKEDLKKATLDWTIGAA